MPSKQTQNYKLNQWVKTDKVLMDDFNADNKKIDDAIKAVETKADSLSAGKAELSDLTALQTLVAGKGNCRVDTTSYDGDGSSTAGESSTRAIRFSARPVLYVIAGQHTIVFGRGSDEKAYCVYNMSGQSRNGSISVSWSGNTATLGGDARMVPNQSLYSYFVVAFYDQEA